MRPLVRILIVTDDQFSDVHGGFLRWVDQDPADVDGPFARDFHLGEFVLCLEETSWVGFDLSITKAHRATDGTDGLDAAQIRADRGADVIGFRFDQPFTIGRRTQTLADFDVVMFFSTEFGEPDLDTHLAEADAIARFMEAGGGFFATGDHSNLGAPLCGVIPRVRSMRRWWSQTGPNGEPEAPPVFGSTRHDTTRPGADGVTNFEDQSDDVPQPIKPKLYMAGFAPGLHLGKVRMLPHPLLCSPDGRITVLPDHMHEGSCEVPDNLAARTFTLDGAEVREYPDYVPDDAPAGYVPQPLAPEVVATGEVLDGVTTPPLDPEHHPTDPDAADGRVFGVIGAWDGHRVGKGRVVVDSTWHHFFDINLSGDRHLEDNDLPEQHLQKLFGFYVPSDDGTREPNAAYRMIMAYFRNIVYWLIPAGRRGEFFWPVLDEILRHSRMREELAAIAGGFEQLRLEHYLYFGQLADRYFAQARGHCATFEFLIKLPPDLGVPVRDWLRLNFDWWDPKWKFRGFTAQRRQQWLGAIGAAPRMDLVPTLMLGAGVIAAATTLAKRNRDDEKREQKARVAAFADIWRRALSEFAKVLAAGSDVKERLARLAADDARLK